MTLSPKPAKQRTEVRQASLVEAALRMAAERSPADITTAELASAVGISQGAVFKHFASKEAIWLALLDWTTDTLMTRLQATAGHAPPAAKAIRDTAPKGTAVTTSPSALPALQAVFLAHVDFVIDYPGVPRVIFQELQSPGETALKSRVRGLMLRYRQLLMQLLQQAEQQRTIGADTDLQAAVVLFIGAVQGLVMQAMISGDVAAMAPQAPGVFAIFEHGLLAGRTLN